MKEETIKVSGRFISSEYQISRLVKDIEENVGVIYSISIPESMHSRFQSFEDHNEYYKAYYDDYDYKHTEFMKISIGSYRDSGEDKVFQNILFEIKLLKDDRF